MNTGIRMTMPEIAKRAQRLSNQLIASHGCPQARTIARKVFEKIEAAYKSQQRRNKDG